MKLKASLPGREALPKGRTPALKGGTLQSLTPCTLYNYTDLLEDYSLDLPSLATTNREMIHILRVSIRHGLFDRFP